MNLKTDFLPKVQCQKKMYFHYIIVLSLFLGLIIVVLLLSMEGQKALEFHKKYLNWYSEVEKVWERHEIYNFLGELYL